jgi:hypothetical protein
MENRMQEKTLRALRRILRQQNAPLGKLAPSVAALFEAGESAMRQRIETDFQSRDFSSVLLSYDRNLGPVVLRALLPHLTDDELSTLLAHVWTAVEFPSAHMRILEPLFRSPRLNRAVMMTDADRIALHEMADPIRVWRGFGTAVGGRRPVMHGWSWTINERLAHWFASRSFIENGSVVCGEVAKANVLAYFNEPGQHRGEAEIIAAPETVRLLEVVPPSP